MIAYEYRCEHHGVFAAEFPMGDAPNAITCAECNQKMVRHYSAPMLRQGPANRMALMDATEKSRDEPDVVSSLPPRHPSKRAPMAPLNPALQRLPRP